MIVQYRFASQQFAGSLVERKPRVATGLGDLTVELPAVMVQQTLAVVRAELRYAY